VLLVENDPSGVILSLPKDLKKHDYRGMKIADRRLAIQYLAPGNAGGHRFIYPPIYSGGFFPFIFSPEARFGGFINQRTTNNE
jgi:hypothetical protein